jgi:hypothetical protein
MEGKSLLDVLRGVILDPEEHDAYAADPASYLQRFGYDDVAPDDLSEAFELVADTLPPDQAAAARAVAPSSEGADDPFIAIDSDADPAFDAPLEPGPNGDGGVETPPGDETGDEIGDADDLGEPGDLDLGDLGVDEPAVAFGEGSAGLDEASNPVSAAEPGGDDLAAAGDADTGPEPDTTLDTVVDDQVEPAGESDEVDDLDSFDDVDDGFADVEAAPDDSDVGLF